ncbi:MAG: hypothetical protein NC350_03150, partial [Corallococcus sp.]|nr:hypothetical protein [Corallococcus sp.]
MKKVLSLTIVMLLVVAFAFTLAACNPNEGAHTCKHVCSVCKKCTSDCTDPACASKCEYKGNHSSQPSGDIDYKVVDGEFVGLAAGASTKVYVTSIGQDSFATAGTLVNKASGLVASNSTTWEEGKFINKTDLTADQV